MSNRVSRTQALAHLASIAAKSKTEDSDVLFFKGGNYKGEWNPNTIANSLPDNTQTNDIFLVAENGSYYSRPLLVGELVRYLGEAEPMLVYSKYLPIDFFLSMLEESDSPTGLGAGFVFGGDFDAEPTVTSQTAQFNNFSNAAIVSGVFTPESPIGSAMANYIDNSTGATQIVRFTWPSSGTFVMGLCTPATETDMQNIFSAADTGFVAIGDMGGGAIAPHKNGNESPSMDAVSNAVIAGDVVKIEYRPSIDQVIITNETANTSLGFFDLSGYAGFSTSLSLFIYGTAVLAFELDVTQPFLQTSVSLAVPEDADGKTYLVFNANENSIFDGKPLKNSDFIQFYDEASKAIVTRLYTDEEVDAVAQAAIAQELEAGGSIYNAIQSAVNV